MSVKTPKGFGRGDSRMSPPAAASLEGFAEVLTQKGPANRPKAPIMIPAVCFVLTQYTAPLLAISTLSNEANRSFRQATCFANGSCLWQFVASQQQLDRGLACIVFKVLAICL